MIRHIAIYTLKNRTDLPAARQTLEEAGVLLAEAADYRVAVGVGCPPEQPVPGVCFGDLVQTVDFATEAQAAAYASSAAHRQLMEATAGLFALVTTMDIAL